ncbi:unnamed protein product, partial [Rotaria magnacalcarata]
MIDTKQKRSGKTTTDINDTTSEYNLEEMIEFIRQNPTTALSVHRHLTQAAQRINPNFNLPIESSTPQTPKRNLDTSENDDVQVFKQQRVLSNGKQRNDGHVNPSKTRNTVLPLENNGALNQSRHPAVVQNQDHLPFEQLKRAVSSNLPCFLIEYSEDINVKKRPSDLTVASAIENHFNQRGMQIKFSLVGHVGNKLKLGVNEKEAYATLISTDQWPTQVSGINIKVIKPKFIPDSFALV